MCYLSEKMFSDKIGLHGGFAHDGSCRVCRGGDLVRECVDYMQVELWGLVATKAPRRVCMPALGQDATGCLSL